MHDVSTADTASEPRLYKVPEAADRLNISEKSLRRAIETNRIRVLRLDPGGIRITGEAIDEFLERAADQEAS